MGDTKKSLANKDEQQPHHNLQCDGQREQDEEGDVETVMRPHIENGLQLGRVGHQQGHVQHALSCTLLSSVVI